MRNRRTGEQFPVEDLRMAETPSSTPSAVRFSRPISLLPLPYRVSMFSLPSIKTLLPSRILMQIASASMCACRASAPCRTTPKRRERNNSRRSSRRAYLYLPLWNRSSGNRANLSVGPIFMRRAKRVFSLTGERQPLLRLNAVQIIDNSKDAGSDVQLGIRIECCIWTGSITVAPDWHVASTMSHYDFILSSSVNNFVNSGEGENAIIVPGKNCQISGHYSQLGA